MDWLLPAVVATWMIFLTLSYAMFNIAGMEYTKYSFSNLGSHPEFGNYFNLLLVFVGSFQIIFFLIFTEKAQINLGLTGTLGMVCLNTTTVAGIMTGLIPLKRHIKIHLTIGGIGFIACIPGWILFGYALMNFYPLRALILLLWGIIIMPIITLIIYKNYLSRNKNIPALTEVLMFIGAFLTDIILITLI